MGRGGHIFAGIAFAVLAVPQGVHSSIHLFHVTIREDEATLPEWHRERSTKLECVQLSFNQDGRSWNTFADMRTRGQPRPLQPPQWLKAPPDTLGAYAIEVQIEENVQAREDQLRPGNCILTASRWGFVPQSRQVELRPGGQTEVELVLARDPDFGLIVTPRWMTAETVRPSDTFWIEASAQSDATAWQAWLESEHFSRELNIESASYGEQAIRHGTEPGWKISARLPKDTPDDMYALRIACSAAESTQPSAVRVWREVPDPLYIVGNFRHTLDDHRMRTDVEVARLFEQTVNVVSPAFYANVDDVGYEDERIWGRISYAVQRHLRVPYFHGLGNHDRGAPSTLSHYPHRPWPDDPSSIAYYRYFAGMRYQSRDFGSVLHVVLPYCPDQIEALQVRPDQDRWIKEDLRDASESGLRLLTCYHLSRFRTEPGVPPWEYTDLLDPEFGLNLVLFERAYREHVAAGDLPTYFGGLRESPALDMVGILEITKLPAEDPRINETVLSMEPPRRVDLQITDGDTVRTNVPLLSSDVYVSNGYLIRDCTIRAFSTAFSGPNDGSQEALTASIERADDGNPLVIRGGHLRFVMRKGTYRVSGGEIVQQVYSDDGTATIVDIKVNVGAGLTQVTVGKV